MFTQKSSLIRISVTVLVLLLVFAGSGQLFAQRQEPKGQVDFFEMSLEELMDVEVISSARAES